MLTRYVLADLVRNPRRTLATVTGVVLGVGLFCGVLFFVDGLSASMTQRAVDPLPIDMQRIVTERAASTLVFTQSFDHDSVGPGDSAQVTLTISNPGDLPTNEVTVRSTPGTGLRFITGSARLDGDALTGFDDNPFSSGPGQTGFNLGTLGPGSVRELTYMVAADEKVSLDDSTVTSTYSSLESVNPIPANRPATQSLEDLARQISEVEGVANAGQLSIADLGSDTLSTSTATAPGPAKIFGFDGDYEGRDESIVIVDGALTRDGAVVSAEAARQLALGIGDQLAVALPDGSTHRWPVTGVADLSRSRSLFSSRRGGDLETFIYVRNSVIVSPAAFADIVFPAFERAIATGGERLKSPPIREIDISIQRQLLDADPATAVDETKQIAAEVTAVAEHQDYLLDNISNTLTVAAADAAVAKRLFVFLGVPGGLLAAALAAYAGHILAEAQRREHAILRIRGASRRHLLRMLTVRTLLLTAAGSVVGLFAGYLAANAVLGRESLQRASTSSLTISALVGTFGGFVATGLALYVTGRRSIDREINEDRARLSRRPPLWHRAWLDVVGLLLLAGGTVLAQQRGAFEGTPGSVYFGRSIHLNLSLLLLPIAVWAAACLLAARFITFALSRATPDSTPTIHRPATALFRRSIGRRPWAIGNGAIIGALIVALAASLAGFTASYDAAKTNDARFANGADIRITPSPTQAAYTASDATAFQIPGVAAVTPVIYGLSNVILRSDRTSDPANLTAIDPAGFAGVAPVDNETAKTLSLLSGDPSAILLSADMAAFLKAKPGDTIHVLLARATDDQVEVDLTIAGLYERLPGFPDGADAVIGVQTHTSQVPTKGPDFFLAAIPDDSDQSLQTAVTNLQEGPGAESHIQIDTRLTVRDRDQSSLAALNIAGLVDLDSGFALAMAAVAVAIFVFGLQLQRRREYVTLRALGLEPRTVRLLILGEAATVALGGVVAGIAVGAAMGYYFVAVLRPLFVLAPAYILPPPSLALPVLLILVGTIVSAFIGSRVVNRLQPTELLRDD